MSRCQGAIGGLADLGAKLGLVGAGRPVGKSFSGSRARLQTSVTIELFRRHIKRFILFHRKGDPIELSEDHIRDYF